MDYDKYRYEQAKKEREIRRNQKVVSIKEVQLSATIEENDIQTKAESGRQVPSGWRQGQGFDSLPRQAITHQEIGLAVMRISSRGLRTWPLWSASPSSRVAT